MALQAKKREPTASAREQTRAYFAAQPASARRGLRLLETTIRDAAPDADAVFSYGIPGFRFDGKPLAWYAAWVGHWSMYPLTPGMRAAGGVELERYQVSKGTLHFAADASLPVRFIKRMIKARVAEIRGAAPSRASAGPKRKPPTKRAGKTTRAGRAASRGT